MEDNCRKLLREYYNKYQRTPCSNWSNFKKHNRKKTKEEILAMFPKTLEYINIPVPTSTGFGYCQMATNPVSILKQNTKDMETTMNTVTIGTTDSATTEAKRALRYAVVVLSCEVDTAAHKKFGLRDDDCPKTAQELVDRIKEGDIILPDVEAEDYDPSDYRYESFLGIRFRKPSMKKDRDGYAKHMETFRKERDAMELEIAVLEPAESLKNFKKFESKWVH